MLIALATVHLKKLCTRNKMYRNVKPNCNCVAEGILQIYKKKIFEKLMLQSLCIHCAIGTKSSSSANLHITVLQLENY